MFLRKSKISIKPYLPYIWGAIIFFAAVILTDAVFWADTADYVDSVINFQQGHNYNFWEFGHLFWRPSGWLGWSRFFSSSVESNWQHEINSTFQSLSYLAGLGSALIFVGILKKLKLTGWIIIVTTTCFIFSHAFLNFTQTGTSYITALMFYLLGIFFCLRETDKRNFLNSILAGAFLALSLCFWMPFLWTIPAVILFPLILYNFDRQRLIEAAVKTGSFILVIGTSYGIILAILQIDSLAELKAWIAASSHDNETRGLLRMIFGLARSFVNMGSDGILFKRFLLSDPFNPVSLTSLIAGSLWKFGLFYSLAAGVLFLLWQTAQSRRIFIALLTAAVPMLSFAVLFDGGAVERYLPLFPFAFISLAFALQVESWKFVRYSIVMILTAFVLINLNVLSVWGISGHQTKLVSRIELLENKASPRDRIFVVNWTDDLINFNRSFPYNPINLRGNLKINSIVTPGSEQTKQWREEFAARSLATWENAGNVWLSNRALSRQPQPDWNWTEGDDKNVGWLEFPEFFSRLEFGEKLGDENGFVLVLPGTRNKNILQEYKNKFAGEIRP